MSFNKDLAPATSTSADSDLLQQGPRTSPILVQGPRTMFSDPRYPLRRMSQDPEKPPRPFAPKANRESPTIVGAERG